MDEQSNKTGRRAGTEPFHNGGQTLPFTVLEFWQWASSDLVGNALRGVLAEYLVAQALGCADGARIEWDAFDLCNPSGLRIEVKTSGYVQSWSQRTESRPTFDIATKRGWYAASNTVAPTPERPADVYVFALHAHRVKETADPLDVSQWEFFVVPTAVLNAHCAGQKSIGAGRIRELSGGSVTFEKLREAVGRASGAPAPSPAP